MPLGSTWDERIVTFNRRQFPQTQQTGKMRHFFMGCHDASGQFLAHAVRLEILDHDFAGAVTEAMTRLGLNPE